MFFTVNEKIDISVLRNKLTNKEAGAMVTFEGWVRNHNEGKKVHLLEYEAYEKMAVKEAEKIITEAKEKFSVLNIASVHRTGTLEVGDMAVWVGVTSRHRGPAFEACEYVIDEIKKRLPIWKKEYYAEGDSGWVNCRQCAGKIM